MKNENKREPKKTGHFTVKVADLKDGPVTLNREMPLSWLRKKLAYCEYDVEPENAHVDLQVEPASGGLMVRGKLSARLRTHCGICLAEAMLHIAPSVSTYLLPRVEMAKHFEDSELTPEDLEKEWFEGEVVALDDMIADTLMLELPMNPRCGESCPGFSQEESAPSKPTIDPRLAPLASIQIEKED